LLLQGEYKEKTCTKFFARFCLDGEWGKVGNSRKEMLGLLKQHNYRLQCNLTTGEFYMLALLRKKTADHF